MVIAAATLGGTLGAIGGSLILRKSSLGQRIDENAPPLMAKFHKAVFVVATTSFATSITASAAISILR